MRLSLFICEFATATHPTVLGIFDGGAPDYCVVRRYEIVALYFWICNGDAPYGCEYICKNQMHLTIVWCVAMRLSL
ncbi:hypothetical protein QT972_21900 [Microcoleus sp. herbarium7]